MARSGALLVLWSLAALRCPAAADPDTQTSTETFDATRRGKQLYGDVCSTFRDCGFPGSICDDIQKVCGCHPDLPLTNFVDKCGRPASINESCLFDDQCMEAVALTVCQSGRCACRHEMEPEYGVDGTVVCKPSPSTAFPTRHIDPAMIGALVAMAVMFIIICVVLRLFSRARWRENRSIFNTPNPRLMNVSLLKDTKHADRRGSRVSMRPPSRQTSHQELRPHSPNAAAQHHHNHHHRKPSGSRRGSRASSAHSATSLRSNHRSPTSPGPTSVIVEIRPPEA